MLAWLGTHTGWRVHRIFPSGRIPENCYTDQCLEEEKRRGSRRHIYPRDENFLLVGIDQRDSIYGILRSLERSWDRQKKSFNVVK